MREDDFGANLYRRFVGVFMDTVSCVRVGNIQRGF